MDRLPRIVLGILLLGGLCAGCEGPGAPSASQEGAADRPLRRGNGGDPGTLDPALAQDVHAFNVLSDLYEGLVAEAPDGSVIPGVAASWTVSDDGRSYEFSLRPDAKWSNGDPVVAADFVRAFRRVAAPETASAYGFLLQPVKNFESVNAGREPAAALGVHALDDRLLLIRLENPATYFLSVLAMPVAAPMHSEASPATSFREPDRFIGNGAYLLAAREINGAITLQRNALYWDADSVHVENVVYLPITNETTELNMYRAGELDITDSIPSHDLDRLIEERPTEVRIAPRLGLYYLAFDLSEEPFDDINLRKALSTAIDRQQIVRLTGRGEQAAFSIVPPGVANHVSASYAWRDHGEARRIELAREAYKTAGYDANNPLRIKLTYDVGDVHERIALAVAAMWHEVLGVETELEKMEWMYFLNTRSNRAAWQVMRFSWLGDYNDPMTFAEIFRMGSPQNLPLYANHSYDRILDAAMFELDTDARIAQMTLAEQTLIDDYPIVPLYFFVGKHLVKPHITGFENNVLDRHPSRFLEVSDQDR